MDNMHTVSSKEASDAVKIQSALEGFAARLAAQRGIGSAQMEALREYIISMEKIAIAYVVISEDVITQYAKLNSRFHELIFSLAKSSSLNRHIVGGLHDIFRFADIHAPMKANFGRYSS